MFDILMHTEFGDNLMAADSEYDSESAEVRDSVGLTGYKKTCFFAPCQIDHQMSVERTTR